MRDPSDRSNTNQFERNKGSRYVRLCQILFTFCGGVKEWTNAIGKYFEKCDDEGIDIIRNDTKRNDNMISFRLLLTAE